MSNYPDNIAIKPLRSKFAQTSDTTSFHNGNALAANTLYHQTVANIAKALLEYAYNLKNTRVFFDVIDKYETCLTFDIPETNIDSDIGPDFQAITSFIKDMEHVIEDKDALTIVQAKKDSEESKTLETPLMAYDIREILPAMRKIAANRMDHCQNNKMWLCALINDMQIELRREANPHLPEFNL